MPADRKTDGSGVDRMKVPPGLSEAEARLLYGAVPEPSPPPRVCRYDTVAVEIESLNEDGRGIGRHEGKVVFVEGALPDERAACCLERQRPRYSSGWAVSIERPSRDRVEPRCEYFGVCGGCNLQHLASEAQPEALEGILRDKFRQFGRLEPEAWLPPITGPHWAYRRRARLGVRHVAKKGGVIVGFRERGSRFLAPLRDCQTLDTRVAALLPALRALVDGLSCRERLPQIEIACTEEAVALVFRHLEPWQDGDIDSLTAFAQRHDVRIYGQPQGPDSVQPIWPDPMPPLAYELPAHALRIEFSPTDFIQINGQVNEAMIDQALRLLRPGPDDTVLDLFCGLGNFSLPLARRAGRVIGVEDRGALVAAARRNAAMNGLGNVEFLAADLYDDDRCRQVLKTHAGDLLLLDPPRSGAMEVIKHLPTDTPFKRIVYVSCQPATLARDCEYLVNVLGYRLRKAGILDMFPQTSNVESMVLLEKPGD